MNDIFALMNEHIRTLTPYSSARDDFKGVAEVYLDANESWYDGIEKCNRYPDPEAIEVRKALDSTLSLPFEKTVLGNGSDEIIDLLIRIFCMPQKDSILIMRPTYGAYKVFADINNVNTIDVRLKEDLTLNLDSIIATIKAQKPKLVFICSPNNPTGKVYPIEEIRLIAKANEGITIVDEAYSDFDLEFQSAVSLIDENPRLCVMRTLSKAWGIAGARVGILVATPIIRDTVAKVKPPYNVSVLAQRTALETLKAKEKIDEIKNEVVENRTVLEREIARFKFVKEVISTKTNFMLIRVDDADSLYKYLMDNGVIVRNRTHEPLLMGCLRITVGSNRENKRLLEVLSEYGE